MHKCSGVEKKTKWKVILLDHFYHDASPLNHGGKYVWIFVSLINRSPCFIFSKWNWVSYHYPWKIQRWVSGSVGSGDICYIKPMDEFQQQQQQRQWPTINQRMGLESLLVEEILHQLIWQITHYLQGFIHLRWCRISSVNSTIWQFW